VKGYSDSSGPAAMNQDVSMRRAQSVIAFLEEVANIALTHLLTPGTMGEARPAAPNGSPQGRAENWRAEIRILTNRGVPGE
jgi:outer membrane protein OmpA-like peptidoglycan-associated protein